MDRASIVRGLVLLVVAVYPIAIFFGIKTLPPGVFGILLAVLLGIRFGVIRSRERLVLIPVLAVLMTYAILAAVLQSQRFLLYYPVLMNACLFGVFAWSLRGDEPFLLRIVRASGAKISPQGPTYLRRLTIVWAGFFVLNGAVAVWTTTQTLEVWALYNGLIAYILVGCLAAGEWLFRLYYKSRPGFRQE